MSKEQYYSAIEQGAEDLGLSPGDYVFTGTSLGDGVLGCHFYDAESNLGGSVAVPV